MSSSEIYTKAKAKAFKKIKKQRDAKELRPGDDDQELQEVRELELFNVESDESRSYNFLIKQVYGFTYEMFGEIIQGLLNEYGVSAKPITFDKKLVPNPPAFMLFTEEDKTIHIFQSLHNQKLDAIMGAIRSAFIINGAEDLRRTILVYDYAYRLRFDHNSNEEDPSRGTGLFSLHDFFIKYLNEKEYERFRSFEEKFTKEVIDYLGYKVTRILTPNSLYSFKRLVTYYFRSGLLYDKSICKKIHPDQLKIIMDRFINDGCYKAMIGKAVHYDFMKYDIDFAQSFITAEWLYDTMKATGKIDYTAVAMGYFKAIEQAMFAVILLHVGEGRQLKRKGLSERVQYDPLTEANIKADQLDTTMGALIGFFRYYQNRDLFNWQIEEDTTQGIILNYLKEVKVLRNGYFHKENLNDWEVVEKARTKAYTVALFLFGAYDYSDDDKRRLNIPPVELPDDYELLCEYMNYNSGHLFYISRTGDDLIPGFADADEKLIFDEYGVPQFSGVYFRELKGITSEREVVHNQDRFKLKPCKTECFVKDDLPVKIYRGEMSPCPEGMMFSGALDLIYNNGVYSIPKLKSKPSY